MAKGMYTQVIVDGTIGSAATVDYGPFLIERGNAFSVIIEALNAGGSIDVAYKICSSKDGTFFTPAGASLIFDDLLVAAVPNAASFTPIAAPWLKISIVNNVAAVHTITAKLVVQED